MPKSFPIPISYSGLPDSRAISLQKLATAAPSEVFCVAPARIVFDEADSLDDFASANRLPVFDAKEALPLQAVHIEKPWGEEVWFTGVESRGVSRVGSAEHNIPITWLLAVCPELLGGVSAEELILLKILAPLPEPVYGDLYLEMHEQKREVYVITSIDSQAWPSGKGAIRMGLDLQAATSPAGYKAEFFAAIERYEQVRRQIDGLLDRYREERGVERNAPVTAGQLKEWLNLLQPQHNSLFATEAELRERMNRFTKLQPLAVGDVVKVPTLTPHALQHGVRAVEFQTPVYERLILSFAQKVLTQGHWDTAKAIELMSLEPHLATNFDLLDEPGEAVVERIVDFVDFEVLRIRVAAYSSYHLCSPTLYGVVMAVAGRLNLGAITLEAEQAALLPQSFTARSIRNEGDEELVFLLALPKTKK
jgi:hypothetical protein